MEINALDLLESFLITKNIVITRYESINETIKKNYDSFDDFILKSLADQAIIDRDTNLISNSNNNNILGDWAIILDNIKEITIEKRKNATNNLEKIISIGNQSDPNKLTKFITILHNVNQLDKLLKELINEAKLSCIENNLTDTAMMFDFVMKTIDLIESNKTNQIVKSNNGNSSSNTNQGDLVKAGDYLNNLLIQYNGDLIGLSNGLSNDYYNSTFDIKSFSRVLEDNINACKLAGYVNKLKVFDYIKQHLSKLENTSNNELDEDDSATRHLHAPQFVEKNITDNQYETIVPNSFLDCSNFSMSLLNADIKNSKKKIEKKISKGKVESLADLVSNQLISNSWAVCDNFLPLDLIRRVRIEANLFINYYEQSEIWLGKDSDVGAHLVVPSVRGDKVLWMCGGHNGAPEGMSRQIKILGEIEPCRLDVKASAPIRRFNAMKDLITAIDKLVNELKPRVDKLKGIYERSDAMIAIYPGNGSRFANHIDNTTRDGRRLTVVLYLNPGWSFEQGGSLRLTTNSVDSLTKYVDVLPISGRLAMFYSSEMAHEVMPTYGDRLAITLWYYDTEERAEALNLAKSAGKAAAVSKSSVESQMKAQEFIAELVNSDEDSNETISKEIIVLSQKLNNLSDETVGIIASVIGVKSAYELRNGFKYMNPSDLRNMRSSFRRMGLNN